MIDSASCQQKRAVPRVPQVTSLSFLLLLSFLIRFQPFSFADVISRTSYLMISNEDDFPIAPYAEVKLTIDTVDGYIDVAINALTVDEGGILIADSNFGIQRVSFNNPTLLGLGLDNYDIILPANWDLKAPPPNHTSEFNIFTHDLSGKGSSRQDPLTFRIIGEGGIALPLAQLDFDNFEPNAALKTWAAHIAAFKTFNGETSAFFADNPIGGEPLQAIFDARGVPLGGSGISDIANITPYGTVEVTNIYSETNEETGDVKLGYVKKDKLVRVVEPPGDPETVNTAGIKLELTEAGETFFQTLNDVNNQLQFFIKKVDSNNPLDFVEEQLSFDGEYVFGFNGNILHVFPRPEFFVNHPAFSLESNHNYFFTLLLPNATIDDTLITDPFAIGTSVLGNNFGIYDPAFTNPPPTAVIPEIPAGFMGVFLAFMGGLVLFMRQRKITG